MVADMQPPDLETLAAIIESKSAERSLRMPKDLSQYLATRVRGSIRELEGVLNNLAQLCRMHGRPPSLEFARQHLARMLPEGPPELDARSITYEYLDGKTTDRQARVAHFQEDPDCRLFLVSLKAGGQGLNLTAADYIYILDPWWNPAVEAQAVDRAHRIGQTRRVFAYRLIARDTVEEKIVALQDRKRELAESIVRADESLITSLTAEDVEQLLS
jgi:hypothetical protein